MTGPHSRAEATKLLFSLTSDEAALWAKRTAQIAEEQNDLGAGMRAALQEIAAARKAGGHA